jgi:membrane fusion protein (multidrug efflux system)
VTNGYLIFPARILTLVLAAAVAAGCSKSEAPPPAPPAVQVATVLQRDVPIMVEGIGQTLGSSEVEIRARTEGFLETIEFKEGALVKKGDLLYTIDPRNLQAAFAQAQGQLAKAKADHARTTQDVARYKPLVAINAIPRQQYDTAVAQEIAAQALVDAAQASVDNATANLEYTKIYAPIDGLIGKTEVKVGTLVGRGQNTLLTQVAAVDPIHVRFSISEQDYLKYSRARAEKPERAQQYRFELVLADGSVLPQRGDLVFTNNAVDATTGTLLVEVTFPNPDRLVLPGQYGRVRVAVDTRKDAILVPQRAVKELQATYSVAVVGADDKVQMRTVKPGARIGSLWIIESGLAAGDKIVVEGLQKVRDGMTVKPAVVAIADDAAAAAPASAPPPGARPAAAAPAAAASGSAKE